jgi:hypothetical protein
VEGKGRFSINDTVECNVDGKWYQGRVETLVTVTAPPTMQVYVPALKSVDATSLSDASVRKPKGKNAGGQAGKIRVKRGGKKKTRGMAAYFSEEDEDGSDGDGLFSA